MNNIFNHSFDYLMKTLTKTIKSYDYFVDWKKISINLKKIEKMLNLLNYLIGKENFEFEFKNLINEYPEIVITFPILLAIRDKEEAIIDKTSLEIIDYSFIKPFLINDELKEKYYVFFNKTGLEDLIKNKKIKNLVDYVFGIEVGMDTNARKNRTGNIMESIVEEYLKKICETNHNIDYIAQATKTIIFEKWFLEIEQDKTNRRFDFAVYNKNSEKLIMIEVNYYSGGGSKLKATAGEYKKLYDFLSAQNIEFIWVTDGLGWKSASKALDETFEYTKGRIINLKMLSEGVLGKTII
ncbi:MAG: type II restriction endonuclease [Candidatus Cloacimonetes bacterium]|nr:type II restriction endonuclease [Candidatus Cloacimonadota bacterium]